MAPLTHLCSLACKSISQEKVLKLFHRPMNSYIEPIWTLENNIIVHTHVKNTHGSSAIPNDS